MRKGKFKFCFSILKILIYCALTSQVKVSEPLRQEFPSTLKAVNSLLTYNIFSTFNTTFCSDNFMDGWKLTHQTTIADITGNEGFKPEELDEKITNVCI